MPQLVVSKSRGFVFESVTATSSTGEGTRVVLDVPLPHWALQVIGTSTGIVMQLQGSLATSSDAFMTTMLTWSSDTNGTTVFSTTPMPARQVVVNFESGASSDGAQAFLAGSL